MDLNGRTALCTVGKHVSNQTITSGQYHGGKSSSILQSSQQFENGSTSLTDVGHNLNTRNSSIVSSKLRLQRLKIKGNECWTCGSQWPCLVNSSNRSNLPKNKLALSALEDTLDRCSLSSKNDGAFEKKQTYEAHLVEEAVVREAGGGFFAMHARGRSLRLQARTPTQDRLVSEPGPVEWSATTRLPPGALKKNAFVSPSRSSVPSRCATRDSSPRPCSSTSSGCDSFHSRRRKGDFSVKDFRHFCLDVSCELDNDTQYHRMINAAINIQRIFRGHLARKYVADLKSRKAFGNKKVAAAISKTEKKYRLRIRRLKDELEFREPVLLDLRWERDYHNTVKDRERARKIKANSLAKKHQRHAVALTKGLRKVEASAGIHKLFQNSPTKTQRNAAAITIQRWVRGWLVRKYMSEAKTKAMKRTLDFGAFIRKVYIQHVRAILRRRGVKDADLTLRFDELLEYVERRTKFELEFDRLVSQRGGAFGYGDAREFFEACGLCPSKKEVENAFRVVTQDFGVEDFKNHRYTKALVVEVAFQIYVPKATKLVDDRKSTWMNPLSGGDEAMRLLGRKGVADTSLDKCLAVVQNVIRERSQMAERGIAPSVLPEDAKRLGFAAYVPESYSSRGGANSAK